MSAGASSSRDTFSTTNRADFQARMGSDFALGSPCWFYSCSFASFVVQGHPGRMGGGMGRCLLKLHLAAFLLDAMAALPRKWVSCGAPTLRCTSAGRRLLTDEVPRDAANRGAVSGLHLCISAFAVASRMIMDFGVRIILAKQNSLKY